MIINNYNTNTNNNDNTSQPQTTTSVPGPVVATDPTPTTSTAVAITTKRRRFPFYVGAAGLLMEDDNRIGGTLAWGGVFNVGIDISKALSANLYGGTRLLNTDRIKFHAGLDLEVMPFRIPVAEDWDFFKVGPMLGVSTAAASYDNIGSVHLGARATLQVTREIAFTAASRINLGMLAFEAGMVTRF